MFNSVLNITALAVFTVLVLGSSATVIGIDFGTNTFKVMLVQGDFQIVLNEQSGRKTRTLVGFKGDERTFGAAAENAARWSPRDTYEYLRDLAGKISADDPTVVSASTHMPYKSKITDSSDEESGFKYLSLQHDEELKFTVHELLAMILQHARKMAEKQAGGPVMDCAITVPVFFTQKEREAILDAAAIAGLKVLSLVNQGTAFALKYAIDVQITEPTKFVVFFDMGQSSLQLSLVNYSTTVGKKNQTVPIVKVIGSQWDTTVSGRELDKVYVDYYAKKIFEEFKLDVYSDPKLFNRLLSEVKKSREILSANKERPFVLESITSDGRDFRAISTREEFEGLIVPVIARIVPNLDALIQQSGISKSDISSVELVGGPMRIPKVQEILRDYFSKDHLAFHINADEGAVFGAAFYAAGFSTQHRVAEIKMSDIFLWKVSVNISGAEDSAAEGENEGEKGKDKIVQLFKHGNKFTAKKTLGFHVTKDFTVEVKYDADQQTPLPAGTDHFIEHYSFSGIPTSDKYNMTGTPKATVQFYLTTSGTIQLSKSEVEILVSEMKPKKKTPPPTEAVNSTEEKKEGEEASAEKPEGEEGSGSGSENDSNSEEKSAEKAVEENPSSSEEKSPETTDNAATTESTTEEVEYEEVVKVLRFPLKVKTTGKNNVPAAMKSSGIKKLADWDQIDKVRVDTQDAKNSLEEYVYQMKEKIYDDELVEHSTEAEREKLSEELSAASSWLEEDGVNAKLSEYKSKKDNLLKLAAKILIRIREKYQRPEIVLACAKVLNTTRKSMKNITQKLEVTEEEVKEVLAQADSVEKWLAEKLAEQEKLEKHEDPVFYSEAAESKCKSLGTKATRLTKRPKKKPPKPPKNEKDGESQKKDDTTSQQEQKQEEENQKHEEEIPQQAGGEDQNVEGQHGFEQNEEGEKPDL